MVPQSYDSMRQFGENIYTVDGEWFETPFRRRMTVVRLEDHTVAIHSAVRMKDADLKAVEQLGDIRFIVVPNAFHSSEAKFYADRYPGAKVYVPEASFKKLSKSMPFIGTLEKDWPLEKELPCVSIQSGCQENVFFHRLSKTLILTDFMFNLKPEDFKTALERTVLGEWNGMLNGLGPSRLAKWVFFRDKVALAEAMRKVREFDFDRLIVSHGSNISTGAKKPFFDAVTRVFGDLKL